jgi:hypothetical protein
MAKKAGRKSSTTRQRRCRTAAKPTRPVKRGELPPLRLTPEQIAALRKQEAELQAGRRALDLYVLRADNQIPPPGTRRQRQRQRAKQQVNFAKELLEIAYPEGEWRTMRIGAIRHGCAPAAKVKGKPLPSRDSFARAANRRS